MATTIKSTSLDFQAIKQNLKTFFKASPEFRDYDFEASGLNNILDVLAYNTHYNALTANFSLNESYLSTAQLRSSIVSLAEGIGYIPRSSVAAQANINMSISTGNVAGRPAKIDIPAGHNLTASIDNKVYTFKTREPVSAIDSGSGLYNFTNIEGDTTITVYEGKGKTKTFLIGDNSINSVYIIPDKKMDMETAVVKVYDSATSNNFLTYTNLNKTSVINDETTLYILKETPNGYYELSFGDGVTLGRAPVAGNKVVLEYISTNGPEGNGAKVFKSESITVGGQTYNVDVVGITTSAAGSLAEDIESIRKNAPFQYAAQNRMVTAADYSSLILRNFGHAIKDIKTWGGEDNLDPEFGVVFTSIVFNDDTSDVMQARIKQSIIDLADQVSVVSFDLKYADPVETFVEIVVNYQFNPKLTTLSANTVQTDVRNTINEYLNDAIGTFDKSFRRSNVLTVIDAVSTAVLSSRADVKLQRRFVPLPNTSFTDITLNFPVPLATPDDKINIIRSSSFRYKSRTVELRNQLNSTTLQIVDIANNAVLADNVGSYQPQEGLVDIIGLVVDSIPSGTDYLKITAIPANQSAISPLRNDIIKFDVEASVVNAVTVSTT